MTCKAAMASITASPSELTMCPNTVKPPFWASRLAELSARLKNHWSVALLGSEPTRAIAIVPRTFESLNSFATGECCVIASTWSLTKR